METLIKKQKVKKYIYHYFILILKAYLFDSKGIDLICLLFILLEKISILRNQSANNIESNSTVKWKSLSTFTI